MAPAAGPAYAERPLQVAYVGAPLQSPRASRYDRRSQPRRDGPHPFPARARRTLRIDRQGHQAASRAMPGWPRVSYRGWLDRPGMAQALSNVRAGLVVLHPTAGYVASYPIGMFEYMATGLPVIASDFAVFRELLEDGTCGLLVEPRMLAALAAAIQWIFDHPAEARAIGEQGRRRVEALYTWEAEEFATGGALSAAAPGISRGGQPVILRSSGMSVSVRSGLPLFERSGLTRAGGDRWWRGGEGSDAAVLTCLTAASRAWRECEGDDDVMASEGNRGRPNPKGSRAREPADLSGHRPAETIGARGLKAPRREAGYMPADGLAARPSQLPRAGTVHTAPLGALVLCESPRPS